MKKFNWKDRPEGTTHRCNKTDTWIRIKGGCRSFWHIGLEMWKDAHLMSDVRFVKMPEPAIDWSKAPDECDFYIKNIERDTGYFYKEFNEERKYIQPNNGVWISNKDAQSNRYTITRRPKTSSFKGVVALTGTFITISRDELKILLISVGYIMSCSTANAVDLLVCGGTTADNNRKLMEARDFGITIMSESEVIAMLDTHGVKLPAAMKPDNTSMWTGFKTVPTDMMLTKSVVFSGNKEGTQITYPARTPVTVIGHANDNDVVLYHKSTMRYAVVDSKAVKPLMSEEQELVEEACQLVDEYCDDATVVRLIKAGYRKQPESYKGRFFSRGDTYDNDDGYCSEIDTSSGMNISCYSVTKELAQELRDYVLSKLS